jgi:hypothetical protein
VLFCAGPGTTGAAARDFVLFSGAATGAAAELLSVAGLSDVFSGTTSVACLSVSGAPGASATVEETWFLDGPQPRG